MRLSLFAVTLAATAVTATAALAHARLVSATPQPAASVRAAPGELVLRFNEPVLARFVTVAVTGPDARALHVDAPTLDPRDGRMVRARLHGAGAAGVYRVNWSAATADMHRMTGSYTFTLRP